MVTRQRIRISTRVAAGGGSCRDGGVPPTGGNSNLCDRSPSAGRNGGRRSRAPSNTQKVLQ